MKYGALAGGLALAAAMLAPPACAQEFPTGTIKIIVPVAPGGAADISARVIGQKLSEIFHQPVVVETQPGASGAIGMNTLRRAPPDGHTIGVVISLAQTIDRIQNKQSSFDLTTDFTPITAIANNPAGLLVNAQVPSRTMTEFLAYAKAKPNELTCATAGIGTAHYLYGQVLNKVAGISLLNVPYRGTTPAFNDLLGGHVPAAIVSLATALPQLANNQVRLLTVFDTKRYAKARDVPAITEVLPQFEPGRTWIGFVAPRNLPGPIIARLHDEIVKILRMPEVVRILEENGLEIIANEPNEFATMIRQDSKIWVEAAVIAGLITQ